MNGWAGWPRGTGAIPWRRASSHVIRLLPLSSVTVVVPPSGACLRWRLRCAVLRSCCGRPAGEHQRCGAAIGENPLESESLAPVEGHRSSATPDHGSPSWLEALLVEQPSLKAASVGRTALSQDGRRRTYGLTQQPHRRLASLELQPAVKLKAGCLAGTAYVSGVERQSRPILLEMAATVVPASKRPRIACKTK